MNGEYDLDEDGYPTWVELGLPLVRCTPTTGSLKPAGGAAVEIRRYVLESRHDALQADCDRLAAELHEARNEQRREHELRCRLAAEMLAKDGGPLSMDQWMHRALKAEAELSAARADAERVEYCVRNALALDFAYGYEELCAIVIQIPKDARYSVVGFRNIIDTARAASSAGSARG